MSIREYAKSRGFEVVGNLKRLKDASDEYGKSYRIWIDEAGNEYWGNSKKDMCIVTADGGVI